MYPAPVQYVLLFAVVISQIFGGISCCCLGRRLLGPTTAFGDVAAEDLATKADSSARPRPVGKCPKCTGRTADTYVLSRQTRHGATVRADGHCGCVRPIINASTPSEPVSIHSDAQLWSNSKVAPVPLLASVTLKLSKFEVPVRFGGHSWQSIACVWKN